MLFKTNQFYWAKHSPRTEIRPPPLPIEVNFLIKNGFKTSFSIREFSLELNTVNFKKYSKILEDQVVEGIDAIEFEQEEQTDLIKEVK